MWEPIPDYDESNTDRERNELPSTAFAFEDRRKEPMTGPGHVSAALRRFCQVMNVTDEERDRAYENIKKAGKHFNVHIPHDNWRDVCSVKPR